MKAKEELINKYLHSELDEQETILFKNLLETDADFANEVELKTVFFADRSSDLKIELEQKLNKRERTTIKPKRQIYSLVYKIAAIFLIGLLGILGFYFFNTTQSNLTLVDNYITHKHDAPSVMMDDSAQEINWQKATNAYHSNNYEETIKNITASIENGHSTSEHYFYLGLAYLYKNPPNYDEAIKQFGHNLTKENKYYQETLWYTSLCHLKKGTNTEAKKQLTAIVTNKYWQQNEAQKLLNQLTK